MSTFDTRRLPVAPDAVAPDGSNVRILLGLQRGGLAHFERGPGETSIAVSHRTVEEIWFVLIPLGTHFQFRSLGDTALAAIGVTMPPWPGANEAFEVPGAWAPTAAGHA